MAKRETSKYILKDGNKVLYVGITNDPKRREAEHRKEKDFQKMEIIGRAVTREAAEEWESNRIDTYKKNHGGKVPPLNKTQNGK
jgi:predicted GIY-YIG superfamily endonuclease